ncbi:cbb3-type cytochrome c oxidase subunit II [Rariglobus hedericola]|uniref:Cytochrome-c oxidase n=1 Tax=Rariglobus hedericola TaxID=2597822 RepID=A0A556QER0_9BACT|nr:cbb3-type cytochrome c oxidase subunit II [Rariglobus hedericola]TSJ75133.1 cytochrome-c oxidase [Rariglobus hedericola]
MNRAPFIFLGVFCALAFSFVGLVLTNQLTYGSFTTHVDEDEGKAFPLQSPGLAAQGKLVYQDLGCVACHTQQVRRPGFGSDTGEGSRGWGERQSVARDYLRESRVLIGSQRVGPDLRNFAARKNAAGTEPTAESLYHYLFDPTLVSKDSAMPRYAFLFKSQQILGEPSTKALKLTGTHAAQPGYEIVPTARGEALVAYLLSLKDTYAYPETKNVYTPPAPQKKAGAPHGETKVEEKKEGHQ